ncbi:Urmylation protein [Onygenales sp. PD_40]|nr:Urmylation protein [Onygenales sp. PD_40]KAK2769830.1 Urmylation protein [Emmonsiellopsis sp. PD_33]KAK2772092.1 Urmylation protein [Onygenales sp. PD_12]
MNPLEQSRERLQQQIATTEARLSQLKAELERTERQIAAENWTTSTSTSVDVDVNGNGNGCIDNDEKRQTGKTPLPSPTYPLEQEEYRRYGRQMIVEQIGIEGQLKLRNASVLIVGAGGLGCPAAMYLAGAGVGRLGIVDGDTVEASNLHRQVLHRTKNIGKFKVDSAVEYLRELNPHPTYTPHAAPLTPQTSIDLFTPYDLILDCTDNPATRYLISDTAVLLNKPLVSASALRTEGQLMVLNNPPLPPDDTSGNGGPCYRCVFPTPPPAESVVSCADGGIIGPVVGVMGVLQAIEAIKVLTSSSATSTASPTGQKPSLTLFSAYSTPAFRSIKLRPRRANCAACSPQRTITAESLRSGSMDYVQFCGGAVGSGDALKAEERISAREYARRFYEVGDCKGKETPTLIDVREPVQYSIAALEGSVNVPMSKFLSLPTPANTNTNTAGELPSWLPPDLLPSTKPIHVVCRLGNDSQVVVRRLKEMGLDRDREGRERWIGDIKGGLRAWREEVEGGFPDY